MVIAAHWRKPTMFLLALCAAMLAASNAVAAEDPETPTPNDEPDNSMASAVRAGAFAIAAAIVMAGAALATARVQAAVGAGGTGVLAEKPDLFVPVVVLIAIPETILVLGFVIALMLLTSVG